MGEYHVQGGRRLEGELHVGGGKNAILPILASTVLSGSVSVIHNCPNITDTDISVKILEAIGCKIKQEGKTLIVDSSTANQHEVPAYLVRAMRSSIIFWGGVLGRFKKVKISHPGGCELGARPIDIHEKGLRLLGAQIREEGGFIYSSAEQLVGARIAFDFPSVGATENVMLAAVLASGETVITNAAKEPEIVDMQQFLNGMGADIRGAGTDTIVIRGVKKLHDVEYTVMPDRIVAGTYLVAAAITGGSIVLRDIVVGHIEPITSKLLEVGCTIKQDEHMIYLKAPEILKPIKRLRTHPHPGFPTDLQPQMMTLLARADGTSIIDETVFESRNKHVGELLRMGAKIDLSQDGTTFMIKGVKQFNGATVTARDLRGGAALILAGLAAEGRTIVLESNHVKRGYDHIEDAFRLVGADIDYVESQPDCENAG